ncbi:MAG: hypothetical protein WCV50_01530 [Patescibacteria group bacterium]|jgi:hypothetical protein
MFNFQGLPATGDPRQADVVIVQAFGRNGFSDQELNMLGKLTEVEQISDVEMMDILRQWNFDPGQSNRELAEECRRIMDKYKLSAIVQWEIAVAFPTDWYAANNQRIICLWPSAESLQYFSTRKVLENTLAKMIKRRWSLPIELAHHGQILRAYLMVRKIFGNAPVILSPYPKSFDRKSVQPWTRSRWRWLCREIIVRWHHLLKRWV